MGFSSPAVAADATIYFETLSSDNAIYTVDADATGKMKWRFATGSITLSPAIATDGAIYIGIYIGADDGCLYALNPDGTEKWRCNQTVQSPPQFQPTARSTSALEKG